MKRRSGTYVVATLAIAASQGIIMGDASARSSTPEGMTTGDLATTVCDFEAYAFSEDASPDFWRHRYVHECSIKGSGRSGSFSSPARDY